MKYSELIIPSNKKFGYFFTFLFLIIAIYFYINSSVTISYFFTGIATIFFILSVMNSSILTPLNRLWMIFGLILGKIISPIILGIIYFGLFTPIAIFLRLLKRDELNLKYKEKASHWILCDIENKSKSFKNQF